MRTPSRSAPHHLPSRQTPPSRRDPLLPEGGKRQVARDALDRGDVGGFSGCASRTRPTRSRRSARGIVVARNDFFRMVVKGLTSKPPFPMVSRLAIFPSLTL